MPLDTVNAIPANHFKESYLWGEQVYVIPEYTFGVHLSKKEIELSFGHKEFRWVSFEEAMSLLKYDGNKTALWELNQKVLGKSPRD
jgi:dATP pyrophosphohydrolase